MVLHATTYTSTKSEPLVRRVAGHYPQDRYAQLPGLRLHYQDYGGEGRPIVLLHGLASSSRIWGMVAPQLARRHRVVALDQRGHGLSDKPAAGYDFTAVTADLASVVDYVGLDRPVIVGHSWGAHVALEYAARYPGRTSGIVLVDGGIEGLDEMAWVQVERELAPPDLTHLTLPQLIAQVKEWGWGAFWNDHVEAALLSLFETDERGNVRPRLSRASHMQIVRAVWEQRLERLYPAVRAPVLIVPASQAADDEATRLKLERVARARSLLPEAHVHWFNNTSHDIPLERPGGLAAAIESFLADGVAGASTERGEINPEVNLAPMAG